MALLLLERLSDAERAGHPILALVAGSAVNQDGASNGLTAPNGPAQRRVIQRVLSVCGWKPSEVDAVEAHGTGTRLGDPIEAEALHEVFGGEREEPLWLGSLKSNVGHTQAAAGAAAVIKAVLSMQHGVLPRTLHAEQPSPLIHWTGAVRLLSEGRAWPERGRSRRCGVSSFGVSGTNAHVLLEGRGVEASAPRGQESVEFEGSKAGPLVASVLTARTEAALRAQAASLGEWLERHPEASAVDVAQSLASRSRFEQRAVLLARGREELRAGLAALAGTVAAPGHAAPIRGVAAAHDLAFLFLGHSPERLAAGALLRSDPELSPVMTALRAELDACGLTHVAALLDPAYPLDAADRAAPAGRFALDVALFRALQSYGIAPACLAGHGSGLITAAHLAGALSLLDAVRLLDAWGGLAARRAASQETLARFRAAREAASIMPPRRSLSSLAGAGAVDVDALFSVEYWLCDRQLDLHAALTTAGADIALAFETEHALAPHARSGIGAAGAPSILAAVPALDARAAASPVTWALAALFVRGVEVDWNKAFVRYAPKRVALPTYPFQRSRYWLDASPLPQAHSDTAATTRKWQPIAPLARQRSAAS